jgi:phage terminase large subunit
VKDNVCFIHTSYLDCLGHVPPDILRSFEYMKEHKPKRYSHVVLGGWLDKLEGVLLRTGRLESLMRVCLMCMVWILVM